MGEAEEELLADPSLLRRIAGRRWAAATLWISAEAYSPRWPQDCRCRSAPALPAPLMSPLLVLVLLPLLSLLPPQLTRGRDKPLLGVTTRTAPPNGGSRGVSSAEERPASSPARWYSFCCCCCFCCCLLRVVLGDGHVAASSLSLADRDTCSGEGGGIDAAAALPPEFSRWSRLVVALARRGEEGACPVAATVGTRNKLPRRLL